MKLFVHICVNNSVLTYFKMYLTGRLFLGDVLFFYVSN